MSDNIKPIAVINKATDILECLVKRTLMEFPLVRFLLRCNSISLQYTVSFRHLKQSTYVMQDLSNLGFYKLGGRFDGFSFISALINRLILSRHA